MLTQTATVAAARNLFRTDRKGAIKLMLANLAIAQKNSQFCRTSSGLLGIMSDWSKLHTELRAKSTAADWSLR